MNLNDIQDLVFKEYQKNGYEEMWDIDRDTKPHQWFYDLAEIGLIHTEVSEAQEAIRDWNMKTLADECADIVIRVMNFCKRKNINLENCILLKHEKNLERGKLHGRKV